MTAEGGESKAVQALLRFDSKAAALVLEEEVREAFFGSISTAIGMHPCRTAHQMQNHILHAFSYSDVNRQAKHACVRRQDSKCSVAIAFAEVFEQAAKTYSYAEPSAKHDAVDA